MGKYENRLRDYWGYKNKIKWASKLKVFGDGLNIT